MPPLSIMIWLPAACGVLGAILSTLVGRIRGDRSPTAGGSWEIPGVFALIGAVAALGLAIGYIAGYSPGTKGLTHVTNVVWIAELGIPDKPGSTA